MTTVVRQRSKVRELGLAIVLGVDVIMFGVIPIFQVLLRMVTNVTTELPLAPVVASLALATFCLASCYWVWQRDASAKYLLLGGVTISSIITSIVKISALRDARVASIDAWTLVQYFGPALLCLALNWWYFLRFDTEVPHS